MLSESRARKDLVAVYYTADVEAAENRLKELGIFKTDHINTFKELN